MPGAEVYTLVAAAATAILKGGKLESNGLGHVRAWGSGWVVGYAMEAVDNSAGGTAARIKMRVA
jgi:hypothetical protein